MRSNKLEILSSGEPQRSRIDEDSNEEVSIPKNNCQKWCASLQTISQKLQTRTFILYSILTIAIGIIRIFYIDIASRELDQYGQNYEIKYRLIDFKKMTDIFFQNFDYQLNQSKHALDVINDIYNIAEVRNKHYQKYFLLDNDFNFCYQIGYSDYDFIKFSRCYMGNVTLCISNKKDEEITYKLRTDSFYKIYYFHTSSIYVTDQDTDDDTLISASQKHFHFVNNLHHKMFIVFPNDKVARIFPVQYSSSSPLTTSDYQIIKKTLKGQTPNLHWNINTGKKYSFYFGVNDYVQTDQKILRISRVISKNSDNSNVGVVSIDIFNSHLNSTFSSLLGSNYNSYFIDTLGNIIQTNIESFSDKNIFSSLQGCYCEQVLQKFSSLNIQSTNSCTQPKVPFSEEDCQFFNMKELWYGDGQYMFFLVSVRDNNYKTDSSNKLIGTILYVYLALYLCLFLAIIFFTRKSIEEYTTDITNPIKQISFKIQRIMHNIFNPKQFSKIRTDEIVIREKTEIRKLAIKFGETFHKLNEKNLFQTTIVSSIDKSYQKSKEISDKPQKDTIVDEVRNIVQSFLDDQQMAINEQTQQQERNKYARSNKSRNNLDASILRE